jgi:hypothetical protein
MIEGRKIQYTTIPVGGSVKVKLGIPSKKVYTLNF